MKRTAIFATIAAGALVASALLSTQAANAADTTVTATVTAGSLSITAPTTLNLGSIAPGTTGTGTLTGVEVTDGRAGTAGWTASVTMTNFTSASLSATIPASDATYSPSTAVTTGTVTVTATPATGSTTATAVQTATAVTGDNTATWNGTVSLAVPSNALAANDYTATITHSVA